MIRGILLLILICSISIKIKASSLEFIIPQDSVISDSLIHENIPTRKHVRAKAIIFTILTGPLGGHRVYLGTRPGAPIIYAVTLGGFFILPLVDLAHIIFTKDISKFEKNQKIIMWGGEEK